MKSTLKLFIVLAAIGVLAVSCEKDNVTKEFIKSGDNEYIIADGSIKNYGKTRTLNNNLDLRLFSSGIQVIDEAGYWEHTGTGQMLYFELFSTSVTDLDATTYTYDSSESEAIGTFHEAYYCPEYDYESEIYSSLNITSGTVIVEKIAGEYEININCIDEDGKEVTGYYKGSIPIYDVHYDKSN